MCPQGMVATLLYFYTNREIKASIKLGLFKSSRYYDSDLSFRVPNRRRSMDPALHALTSSDYAINRRRSSSQFSKSTVTEMIRKISTGQMSAVHTPTQANCPRISRIDPSAQVNYARNDASLTTNVDVKASDINICNIQDHSSIPCDHDRTNDVVIDGIPGHVTRNTYENTTDKTIHNSALDQQCDVENEAGTHVQDALLTTTHHVKLLNNVPSHDTCGVEITVKQSHALERSKYSGVTSLQPMTPIIERRCSVDVASADDANY